MTSPFVTILDLDENLEEAQNFVEDVDELFEAYTEQRGVDPHLAHGALEGWLWARSRKHNIPDEVILEKRFRDREYVDLQDRTRWDALREVFLGP